jgi:hypothetical protein
MKYTLLDVPWAGLLWALPRMRHPPRRQHRPARRRPVHLR